MRTPKPRKSRINDANENSIMHRIKNKDLTIAEKRVLVAQSNPFLYALGKKLKVASYE